MTDNEIIKALECHAHRKDSNFNCCDCDYIQFQDCSQRMSQDTLDLINRQQETIKTLRNCVEQHHIIRKDGKSPLSLLTAEIKAEAYKEFADKLKLHAYHECDITGYRYLVVQIEKLDNLLNELVGDGDGKDS